MADAHWVQESSDHVDGSGSGSSTVTAAGGITQGEIDLIRKNQEAYMGDEVIIKRREMLGDNENEYFPINDLTYLARFTPGFGSWGLVADRFQGITAYTVTLPWDTPIRAGDAIVRSDLVFEVRDVKAPGSYITARQCLCDLVTDDG